MSAVQVSAQDSIDMDFGDEDFGEQDPEEELGDDEITFGDPGSAKDTLAPSPFVDEISVVQRKPFLRKGRAELAPVFATTVNDSLIKQFNVGGQLSYHISESIWISGGFEWFELGEIGGVTDEYFEVLERTSTIPDLVEMKWSGIGQVGYVPLFGKFALLNRLIIYYDLSVTMGGAWVSYTSGGSGGEAGTFAGVLGLQQRTFLTDWLALTLTMKDQIFLATMKSGGGTSDELTQIVSVGAGLSIFMPFGFDYTTER